MNVSRRRFLTLVGVGGYAAVCSPEFAAAAEAAAQQAEFPGTRAKPAGPAFFEPIPPAATDELELPKTFSYKVVVRWGDEIGVASPEGPPERFGFNNDFLAYFPIDALSGGKNTSEGLLWVNHEYPDPLFVSGYTPEDYKNADKDPSRRKTEAQIRKERRCVGGSVVQVQQAWGAWKLRIPAAGEKNYNRRFCADYPTMAMTGPAGRRLNYAVGTLGNCSGGRTPWNTALSCEENYPDYNSSKPDGGHYRWSDQPDLAIDELRFGWMVEVDPFGELPPVKHTALGRFKHENAAVGAGKSGRLVVYMGDDEVDQHLYKYVSARPVDPAASRAEQRKALEDGTLYAADLTGGKWIPLVWNEETKKAILASQAYADAVKADPNLKIDSQGSLLIYTRTAARALKATPLDRCEDCEIHPLDGSLYVALTNNAVHGNLYGQILRLVEDGDDAESLTFRYELFLAGGPQSGLACPDNLAFDREGNLWVVCDVSSDKLPQKAGDRPRNAYRSFLNNGLFVVPTRGANAGFAYQFASAPIGAELTGPCFTDDFSTLFLSVQHPGEGSKSAADPSSRWPNDDAENEPPKPAVVAITGFPRPAAAT